MKFKTVMLAVCGAVALACAAVGCGKKTTESAVQPYGLKDAFKGHFLFGAAINEDQVSGRDSIATDIIKTHFNTIVAENVMKSEKLNPKQGYYNWAPADEFVKFGEDNDMFIVGHCLVWHQQLATWFPYDAQGQYVSADTLKNRMRDYIFTVVGRYKGRVHAWDVVNEAIDDDGSYRHSPYYDILGEEFIPYAFELAHEADPDAELYINDYGMEKPARCERYIQIVNDMKARGIRIDGIGMQGHMGMDNPWMHEFESALEALAGTGCKIMLTEWDMSALPTITDNADITENTAYADSLNPYINGLPAEVEARWSERMDSVLAICIDHSDCFSRINVWGVSDGDSWRNDWPIKGRTEYCLLFDRNHQMKPFLTKYLKK